MVCLLIHLRSFEITSKIMTELDARPTMSFLKEKKLDSNNFLLNH